MKKVLSLILILTLIFNMGVTVFATSNDDALSVIKLAENRYLMNINDEVGILTVKETAKDTKLTVEVSGEVEGYFYIDRINDTIYSSYTGKTISISEIEIDNVMIPQAVGDIVESTTHKISYAAIGELVSSTASQIGIAGALITILAAIMGVTIATGPTVLIAAISLIPSAWDLIRNGIAGLDENHGIKVVVDKVEIQKYQGGRLVKGYRYDISSVTTY